MRAAEPISQQDHTDTEQPSYVHPKNVATALKGKFHPKFVTINCNCIFFSFCEIIKRFNIDVLSDSAQLDKMK